jgi:hypothetical protein
MNRRWLGLVTVFVFVCLVGQATLGDGLRSIGLRAVLPMGRAPFLVGIEATGDLSFGWLTGSFFLSAEGKALITTSCDLRLAGDAQGSRTFVRLTVGLYYFDATAFLPSVLFGGGLALEVPVASFLAVGASGEFLYPLAFPAPLVSFSGRWLVP